MQNKYSRYATFPHTTLQVLQRLANRSTLVVRKRESSLIEQQWLEVAKQRLDDVIHKRVETIPYDVVFKRVSQRLSR